MSSRPLSLSTMLAQVGSRDQSKELIDMTEHTPAEVADEIAELVRTLNYQTGAGGTVELEYPADLCSVVANLKLAVSRLPQLFDQMGQWLAAEHEAGRIAHDRGRYVGEYVAAAVEALSRASVHATTLTISLDAAQELSAGLKADGEAQRREPDPSTEWLIF